MLERGPAKKLIIYVSEDDRYHGEALYEAIAHVLHKKGMAGATITKGIAGFGAHGVYHTTKILRLTENLPIRIEVTDTPQKIDSILPTMYAMVEEGLIEVQDTVIIKYTHKHEEVAKKEKAEVIKLQGQAKMIRVYISESDLWEGEPLYVAIVKRLRFLDIAGATVYRGIMGYGASSVVHKQHLLIRTKEVPMIIAIVDTEEKIKQLIPVLDTMVEEGLVVLSDVDVIKYSSR